ncbi:MAG: hypothetical protein GY796_27175 [Chloroflexi bacterium]|nr:hypothetical protein [Chloroflexota bacterium]
MNESERYREAIERYIAARPRVVWPTDYHERDRFISRNPIEITEIQGLPKNCLPLFTVLGLGPTVDVFGILTDTRLMEARVKFCTYPHPDDLRRDLKTTERLAETQYAAPEYIDFSSQPYQAHSVSIHPGLQPYFEELIRDAWLGALHGYRGCVGKLRRRYPAIAPLLIDPPEIPLEAEKAYSYRFS